MDLSQLKEFLDEKYDQYNTPEFIPFDPICIPHRYSHKEDIEISGLFAAIIAWGRREMILRNAKNLMERMDDAPYEFISGGTEDDFLGLGDFVHRTFQGVDAFFICKGLQRIYAEKGGLEKTMGLAKEDQDTMRGLMRLRNEISAVPDFPQRTFKHLANPTKGSSAKRLNMFLRWMVRDDGRGVDFGLWKSLRPDQLICPLDVHTGNVGRKLGLLNRKQNDWKAAVELTESLRQFDPSDPVKYDISLFSLGVNEKF